MSIRDLGYRRYDGPRLPHRSRHRVLASRTLTLAWASGLVKTTLILGMFPMVVCGVILFLKMKTIQMIGSSMAAAGQHPDLGALTLEDPGLWVYYCIYWCQIWFAFSMSLLTAAPAIAEDVRTGAFQFYFARPVSRGHYLTGKLVPVLVLVAILCAVPALLLASLRLGLSQNGAEVVKQLPLLWATLAYTIIYAAVISLPPLALSALSRRSGTIQGAWAALFFLPWLLGEGMAAATGIPYVALVSIPTDLRLVGQYLYGLEPSYPIPWYLPAGVLLGLVVASVWLLLHRLGRVEVFT